MLEKVTQDFYLLLKGFLELARFFKSLNRSIFKKKIYEHKLTLDEMILQYSENPFIDEKMFDLPSDTQQKQKILSRLLNIASNLFSKAPVKELNSYKRRYEIKYGV
jgi:hypothetical protein